MNKIITGLNALLIAVGVLFVPTISFATSKEIRDSIFHDIEVKNIRFYDLEIIARQGKIILKGTVANQADRQVIENITKSTSGVKSVSSFLRIQEPVISSTRASLRPQSILRDEDIAEAVRSELKRALNIKLDSIKITVKDGIVVLDGSLANHRQIDYALSVVLMVDGVKDIESNILIGNKAYAG